MLIDLTKRERATVLAALRRWLSYPAARDADPVATSGRKHKPLDNSEIERLCKRINGPHRKAGTARILGQANNGVLKRKGQKGQECARKTQTGSDLRLGATKRQPRFR